MVSFDANRPYADDYNKAYSEIMRTYYEYEQIVRKTYRPREISAGGKRVLEELQKKRARDTSQPQSQPPCPNPRKRHRRETSEEVFKRKEQEKIRRKGTLNLSGPIYGLGPRTSTARNHTPTKTKRESMDHKTQHTLKPSACLGSIKKPKLKPQPGSIKKVRNGLQTRFVGDGAQFLERLRREGEVNQVAGMVSRKLKLEDQKTTFTVPIDAHLTPSMSQKCGIKPMWPLFVRDPIGAICKLVKTKLRLN